MSAPRARRRVLHAGLRCGALLAAPGMCRGALAAGDAALPGTRRTVVTSDGVQLSVIERAPASPATAAVFLLLPGWCMPASIWQDQLLGLDARWPVLAMDPRGQGESQVAAAGYTADRRADDLHDVIESLGAGGDRPPVVLVGWSLGVLEALQYVQRHGSARLRGLALVDNSIGEPPAPAGGGGFLRELRQAREAAIDRFVRGMFARPPAESLIAQIRRSALRMPLEASLALLSYPQPREHWRDLVHGFDRPLAYLVTPRYREQSEHLRRARPAARVEVFEHAGHALFVDEAARFNRVLEDWAAGLA